MARTPLVGLLDGTVLPVDRPLLRADDAGVSRGDGMFESLLAVDGEPRDLDEHLNRLAASAQLLDIAIPAAEHWRHGVAGLLAAWAPAFVVAQGVPAQEVLAQEVDHGEKSGISDINPHFSDKSTTFAHDQQLSAGQLPGQQPPAGQRRADEAVVRLFATRGPERGPGAGTATCWMTVADVSPVSIEQRTGGIRVLLLDRGFSGADAAKAPWLLAGAKTLSYAINMAALRHAAANQADDVIFMASDGAVLEAPTATVVVATGARTAEPTLLTPPLSGILDGITVRRLFRAAAAAGWRTGYRPLTAADLQAADGVWLASSIRLLAPVSAVDGVAREDAGLTADLQRLLGTPGWR